MTRNRLEPHFEACSDAHDEDGMRYAVRVSVLLSSGRAEDHFASIVQPAFQQRCHKCRGQPDRTAGQVDLRSVHRTPDLTFRPELITRRIDVPDAAVLPPAASKRGGICLVPMERPSQISGCHRHR